ALLIAALICSLHAHAQGPGGVSANLRLWLKGNTGVTGSPVSSWADQSGSGFSAAQATVAFRPAVIANRLNFNPAVQFDGINDQLVITNGILANATYTNINIFAIVRTNSISASSVFLETLPAGNRLNAHIPWTDNSLYWDAGSTNANQRISTPWVSSVNQSYLWSLTASTTATASGARQDVYRNGLILANDNTMTSFTGGSNNFSVGNGFGFFNGELSELVVYTGALTAAQLNRIHSYLALKYGITIDQSTAQNYIASDNSVIWNATTMASYANDIAGIGRDDNALLDQRKSSTSNTPSDVITMANGNFGAPTAFGADLRFLVWGHNGQPLSADPAASSFVHNGVTIQAAIKRIWGTFKSGGPTGNVIVEVNMAQVGGGTGANTDMRLLIDNDAVFGNGSAGEQVISPTVGFPASGGLVDFTVPYASLAAGQGFMTLGSVNSATAPLVIPAPGGVVATTKLWLKANQGATGSPVSAWNDQSGNGFSATQGTVANRPAFASGAINFNPSLQFNGTSHQLVVTGGIMGLSTYTDFNAVIVSRTNAIQNSSIFYENMASGGRINAHIPWSDAALYWDAGSAVSPNRLSTPWTGSLNVHNIWTLTSSTTATATGQRQDIYKNGLVLANDNTMNPFIGNGSDFYIGSLNGANFHSGEIAEIIFFASNLNSLSLQKIHSYLATKYGITLDQTTPLDYVASNWNGSSGTKIWDATTGGTFKNDIAAIGRDDSSPLNQKQSASINSNNVLTIGNVTIAADNASNANSFATDRTFFSWAHNGNTLNASGVADIGTSVNAEVIRARLARVWKAQETGTTGSLKLRFDLSQVPGAGGVIGNNDLSNIRLLVDANGVFASGATSVAPTTFNNTTHVADFDFDFTGATGYFFTIGSVNLTSTPLPIELVSFKATAKGKVVDAEWVTASEKNNNYFVLESSSDAEQWTEVAFVKGKGTVTTTSYYTAVDTNPLAGKSYYRLKQVDFDGKYSYSRIVPVELLDLGVVLYPNPVKGDVVHLNLIGVETADGVRVHSIQGTEMYRSAVTGSGKYNRVLDIPIVGWAPGIYVVTVYTADDIHNIRLVVR
ncbi:MAG TPA: T9SS type A sorting domain-containing protein, partial [Cyclobacteriaceae bacterium]|nr:T9SS type A sorting domain-containing protein [Cyclobacteriaceae bacterium]